MSKIELIILAIALSLLIWSGLIWATSKTLSIGGTPSGGSVLLFLVLAAVILCAFPTVLIWAVNKCSEPTTRNIIWGGVITLYSVFPVSVAMGELMNLYRSQVVAEAEEKLRDEKISYEDMVEALLRAGYPEDYLLTYMLCLNRIDFAERYIRENPKARYQNLPDMMYRYYSASKMDDWSNYNDSLSGQAAVIAIFLLDNGWDINATGEIDMNGSSSRDRTALYMAISSRDLRTANLLLERGADVNRGGYSCLWIAILMDDAKRVQMLIERGAHLNEEYGESLLYTAVKGNNTGIVKMLLDAGAKPHSNESLFPLVDKQTNPELWSLLAPKNK